MDSTGGLEVVLAIVVAGIACVFWGAYILKRAISLRRNGIRTEALVARSVMNVHTHGSRGTSSFSSYPVLKFDVGGAPFETGLQRGFFEQDYAEGALVQIIYDRKNPKNIDRAGSHRRLVAGVLFTLVGACLLALVLFPVIMVLLAL